MLKNMQLPQRMNDMKTAQRPTPASHKPSYIKILCKVTPSSGIIPKYWRVIAYGVFFLGSVVTPFTSSLLQADTVNLAVIAQIESSGRPNTKGDGGKALGLYQLHEGLISDYNRLNHTSYSHKDALNPQISHKIASWATNTYFPHILRLKKKKVTPEAILTCFNAGCGRVDNPPASTRAYIARYKRLSHEA